MRVVQYRTTFCKYYVAVYSPAKNRPVENRPVENPRHEKIAEALTGARAPGEVRRRAFGFDRGGFAVRAARRAFPDRYARTGLGQRQQQRLDVRAIERGNPLGRQPRPLTP